ncbi:hypothetical protein Misp01_46610 [Microtetraspora sp. NBRC 13810]|uniref:AfsR/SARP family transcriptional regulator n=1 Tax=Microtetraspora sp. NBRC 13810 TaxID=3030990 RepID=UPI0024A21ED1|nr:BTAD domain-containing putative transcriptional regulator [Microtetraspora sp. NBRC 13810]GLW09532.1 hypothetical protein Misp01_46610 [Microtetraspora sp. NBRC 13810]
MLFGVLGPVSVWTTGGDPVTVPGVKVRALLADLLLHEGRAVPAGLLIDDLWGDDLPGNPAGTLSAKVSQLRRALEDAEPGGRKLVVSGPAGYRLHAPADGVDAGRFAALTGQARRSADPGTRAALLTDALALWRGPAFADFADEPFTRAATARLDEQRLTAWEDLAEARLALGDHGPLCGELADLLTAHPLRERLRAAHMRALYRAGRQSEALDSYERLRSLLAEELGLDPGAELVALHRAILTQDPELTAPNRTVLPQDPGPAATGQTLLAQEPGPAATGQTVLAWDAGPAAMGQTVLAREPGSAATGRAVLARESGSAASGQVVPAGGPGAAATGREAFAEARPATNLPAPLSELIGRQEAIAEVRARLATDRLVTLTGPGGVGKTRLAVETGRGLLDGFADGVWLVELAGFDRLESTASLVDVVMTALDLRDPVSPAGPADRLARALAARRLLLVLDNCEHVVDQVAELAAGLLGAAPGLRVLATSREPLGVPGEVVWSVPPLEVPARGAAGDLAELARSSAVRLFTDRAAAAARGFTLDADTAEAVTVLCRRLDGIPLALELAATRVRALGVQGLVARLDDRFRLLVTGHRGAPPRQQTLTAMIDWSWELLTGPERIVLRRLAVHADGCTLEAAEAVCADAQDGPRPADVLDLLARLVDRSLVVVVHGAEGPRYRLLESVAAYCVERMHEAGDLDPVRRRHRGYYTELAARAEPYLYGHDQRIWLRRLDAEAANLRAALDGAVAGRDAAQALRLACSLTWYWYLRGRLAEAGRSLAAALAVEGEAPPAVRARALAWRAGIALLHGDGTTWVTGRDAALRLYDDAGDPAGRARAEWFLAGAWLSSGDMAGAAVLLDRALADAVALGDRWGEAAALVIRAKIAHFRGDLAGLERDGTRADALFAELGDRWGRLQATEWLGGLAEMTGDYERAERLHRDGLRMAEDLGLWTEVAGRLCWLGWLALQTGEHERAMELGGRAVRLAADQGHQPGLIFAETVLGFAARRRGDLSTAETHLHNLLSPEHAPARAPEQNPARDPARDSEQDPARAPEQDPERDPDAEIPLHLPMVMIELGFTAELRGDAATAYRLHRAAFDAALRNDAPRDLMFALEGLAGAVSLAGRHEHAARMLGAAAAAREAGSLPLAPIERDDVDRVIARIRTALPEAAFARAHAEGGTLTPAEAAAADPVPETPASLLATTTTGGAGGPTLLALPTEDLLGRGTAPKAP